ncbi:MAG: hypothetical protein EAY81_04105 [Bacteroidetes bacterium]|nr:MAG: hypothetical protein EAY81_04105 [Bacteroidota bacterium]
MKSKFIILVKYVANAFIIALITLLLFELCYRYHIIDFYHAPWAALNQAENNSTEVDLLVFGDSFSAKTDGYIDLLRKRFPNKKILNAAVSGIGIKQVNLFAAQRIKQTKPKAILYQVYVGNDLLDVKNLTNWGKLSFTRNLYWAASDVFSSLRYLNQQLVVLRKEKSMIPLSLDKPFSMALYDKRSQMFTQADEAYLFKTVTITDDFLTRYHSWKKEMDQFIATIPSGTTLYISFIPHCAQLNTFYLNNQSAIGNAIADTGAFFQEQYPFIKQAMHDFKNDSTIVFLNPLATLRKADKETYRLYYENDPHFNINGHLEFAGYLATNLFGVE